MSRVLAYTSPGRSHLFPLTPILDELHARGHEIVLRTLASQLALMQARGFDAAPIDSSIEALEHDDWRARSPLQSVRLNARTFCARAEHDAPDLALAIAETEPDAVLVDVNSWGALMAAEERRGRPRRHAPARQAPARRPPTGQGQGGDGVHRGGTADRRRLCRHRRSLRRGRRRRGTAAARTCVWTRWVDSLRPCA